MKVIDMQRQIFMLDDHNFDFPTLDMMKDDLVAVGGNLHPQRVLNAYYAGIFPWFMDEYGWIHWFSPQKRMVLYPEQFKVSKSLKRVINNKGFVIKTNVNFKKVIENCAKIKRKNEDDTWISDEFIETYCYLNEQEYAYSIETYLDDELVGGLYGLMIGDVFCGESMFSKVPNASKVAFYHLCQQAKENDIKLIDCQVFNPHLASLGAFEIDREEYYKQLKSLTS